MNKSKHFSGHPVAKQVLNLIPPSIIYRTAKKHDSDRYYKRFKTHDHLVTMLCASLIGVNSFRELSGILLACEGRIGHLNLNSPRAVHSLMRIENARARFLEIFIVNFFRSMTNFYRTAAKNLCLSRISRLLIRLLLVFLVIF